MKKLLLLLFIVSCARTFAFAQAGTVSAPVATTQAITPPAPNNAPVVNKQATAAKPARAAADCYLAGDGIRRWCGAILIVIILGGACLLALRSDILRDKISDPVAFLAVANALPKYAHQTDINKIPKPFSLSRSQLCTWTVVIACTYVYLEFWKYVPPASGPQISNTLLELMGISAATAAAGSVIDNSNGSTPQVGQSPSEGFFRDILSDNNGINIHRFQNVVWTLIALLVFIGQVPHVLCDQLPVLDQTLILLTGISSATYLGLKINENNIPSAITPAIPPPGQPMMPPVIIPPVQPIMPPVQPVVPPIVPPANPPAGPNV